MNLFLGGIGLYSFYNFCGKNWFFFLKYMWYIIVKYVMLSYVKNVFYFFIMFNNYLYI